MTRQCFLPGVKDLPQEYTQLADVADAAAGVATDAAAGVAARMAAGVAASIPPAISAIGVMTASGRYRFGLSPRWLARKARSSLRVSKTLLFVTDTVQLAARSGPLPGGTDDCWISTCDWSSALNGPGRGYGARGDGPPFRA
jgi:hypothetical protein